MDPSWTRHVGRRARRDPAAETLSGHVDGSRACRHHFRCRACDDCEGWGMLCPILASHFICASHGYGGMGMVWMVDGVVPEVIIVVQPAPRCSFNVFGLSLLFACSFSPPAAILFLSLSFIRFIFPKVELTPSQRGRVRRQPFSTFVTDHRDKTPTSKKWTPNTTEKERKTKDTDQGWIHDILQCASQPIP
ncbi:hypothetical protein B0H65DRAFT_127197 [Neurospora tetraspora]|uniref:Uncharacterized protein n=1 Tax=Neurospora tetraspora TaxID=94610 RepID=A0AAE0JL44_9PEZI|nr:hypothetical protein B0H65DRAFT_127197 [Neurospora tetraspora]